MDPIDATRDETGQSVRIEVVDGRLTARTPDGEELQSQAVAAGAITLRGATLTWRGVDYRVDDVDAARELVDSLPPKPSRRRPWTAAAVVLALLAGVVIGVVLRDRIGGTDCSEARDIVDAASATMEELNETEAQDRSFLAAVIVEQRTITFTMRERPNCFSLTERATAEGLLEGIRGLLGATPG